MIQENEPLTFTSMTLNTPAYTAELAQAIEMDLDKIARDVGVDIGVQSSNRAELVRVTVSELYARYGRNLKTHLKFRDNMNRVYPRRDTPARALTPLIHALNPAVNALFNSVEEGVNRARFSQTTIVPLPTRASPQPTLRSTLQSSDLYTLYEIVDRWLGGTSTLRRLVQGYDNIKDDPSRREFHRLYAARFFSTTAKSPKYADLEGAMVDYNHSLSSYQVDVLQRHIARGIIPGQFMVAYSALDVAQRTARDLEDEINQLKLVAATSFDLFYGSWKKIERLISVHYGAIEPYTIVFAQWLQALVANEGHAITPAQVENILFHLRIDPAATFVTGREFPKYQSQQPSRGDKRAPAPVQNANKAKKPNKPAQPSAAPAASPPPSVALEGPTVQSTHEVPATVSE